jgi:prepilin-type N-terminal cleavage/methylation domain-containing protein
VKESRRGGFTLIELLVVIAIIGLLAAILVPAITTGMDRARRSACLNNVKELTEGFLAYGADHKGRLPGPNTGFDDLTSIAKMMYTNEYVSVPSVWVCPADKGRSVCLGQNFASSFSCAANCSYIYFAGYNSLKASADLAKLPLVADRARSGKLTASDSHGEKYRNVGYLGGAVKGLKTADEANGITGLSLLQDYDIEVFEK